MSTKQKRTPTVRLTAFWDTSGIVPLCCHQPQSTQAYKTARLYSRQVVWWATPVEAVSALHRLVREEYLNREGLRQARKRLAHLRERWTEVEPAESIRDSAERILGIYKLRTADALQLASALVWCNHRARGHHLIGSDQGLSDAAESEGFTVIQLL